MALSQCAALMEDVPHRRARSGLGPLGRDRLQGGAEAPGSRDAADTVGVTLHHAELVLIKK